MSTLIVVTCESNIGGGKTTLIDGLVADLNKQFISAIPVYEPIDDEITPLLEQFYRDITSPCYELQELFIRKRFAVAQEAIYTATKLSLIGRHVVVLIDRSLYGNSCFIQGVYSAGRLTDREYAKLRELETNLMEDLPIDLMFYLDVPPEVCQTRILTRGRKSELNIPLEYLYEIDKEHKLMVEENKDSISIVTIDAARDSDSVRRDALKEIEWLF